MRGPVATATLGIAAVAAPQGGGEPAGDAGSGAGFAGAAEARWHGCTREGLDLLALRYGWFTEGFDTRDLCEARALFEELL